MVSGRHELRRHAGGLECCIGCALCAAACPADAICVEAADALHTTMTTAQEAVAVTKKAWDAARDAATQAEWDFHDFMLEVKQQVVAQYGNNSDQAQAVGMKKSEYKEPSGREPGASK